MPGGKGKDRGAADGGKRRQSKPAAARLDTDDGEARGGQAMQAYRDNMKKRVASAPSNRPEGQKTDVTDANQNIPGGKRKDQGSAMGKRAASERDDESASDMEVDGGQAVPLPVKRTRRIAPGNMQMESESNSHEVFKGRQTVGESPQAALLRQMNAVKDPLEMAKEYVARPTEGEGSISSLKTYDHLNSQVMIRVLDFWCCHRSSTLTDARAFLNQDLFAVALSMMISLNGNPSLSQLIA